MLRKLKPLIAGLLLGFLISNGIAYAANNGYLLSLFEVKIFVNGQEKKASDRQYQYYNGKEYVPAALSYNGTTYVPLRFFSEILGQQVKYDSRDKAIHIGESAAQSRQTADYLIVLDNERLIESIRDFVEYKKSQGYIVDYVVAGKITAKGSNNAEKLRNYLIDLDKKDDLEFVLFIGDPFDAGKANKDNTGGNIPMKYFYYFSNCHNNEFVSKNWMFDDSGTGRENGAVPTDLYYYTDLNWDADKDGYFGEVTDDVSVKKNKAQFKYLYKLGRIPFNDPDTVSGILSNSMQKESEYAAKKGPLSVLTAGGMISFNKIIDGAFWAEKFRVNLGNTKYKITTLYEQQGVVHSKYSSTLPLTPDNFSNEWEKGYDIICTIAHGGHQRYVWNSDTNKNGEPDEGYGNIFFESFIVIDKTQNRGNGFMIMDGCSTAKMEKDRYGGNIPQLPELLADGLIACGVGTTKENLFGPDEPAHSILPYWKNANSTYGGNFQDAIVNYFKNFPSESFDFYHTMYSYNYFGDPSFKME